jgi:hypothetical protein
MHNNKLRFYLLIGLFLIGFIYKSHAGNAKNPVPEVQKKGCLSYFDEKRKGFVYLTADVMPSFPGGSDSIQRYVRNFMMAPVCLEFENSVFVQFIVETDGRPSNIVIVSPQVSSLIPLQSSIIAAFKRMTHWKPAMCKDKKIPVRMLVAIKLYD